MSLVAVYDIIFKIMGMKFCLFFTMAAVLVMSVAEAAPRGVGRAAGLGFNPQGRPTTVLPVRAATSGAVATPGLTIAETNRREEFLAAYSAYRRSFEDMRQICFESHQAVDGVLAGLSNLLGTSIGVIVGGGVGAAAGGVNIWLTGRTMSAEEALPELERRVLCIEEQKDAIIARIVHELDENCAGADLSEDVITELIQECMDREEANVG